MKSVGGACVYKPLSRTGVDSLVKTWRLIEERKMENERLADDVVGQFGA